MFYFEDTTTTVENDDKDDKLIILDGTVRQELRDQIEKGKESGKDDTITLLDRIRKLM